MPYEITRFPHPGAIDADGHVLEPANLWEEYLEARHRPRALRIRVGDDGFEYLEVDGVPTPDLDAFLEAVSGRPDRSSLRLKTVNWNDAVDVMTLKLDKHYWPPYQLRRGEDGNGWTRSPVE